MSQRCRSQSEGIGAFLSSCPQRTPGSLRVPPIDPFEQVTELCRCDRDDTIGRRRPEEATPLQALGVEREAEPVVPENLDQITSAATKGKDIARVRVATEVLLHLQRQAVHAAAHVGHARRQPHPHPRRHRDHARASTASTRTSAASSTSAPANTRYPFVVTISIWLGAGAGRSSTTTAGTKPPGSASTSAPAR